MPVSEWRNVKGSIRKRGQTWTAYWFTHDASTGKRKQHSKGGFRTKGDAQHHLNEVIAEVQRGSWVPNSRMTVNQLMADWLASCAARGLRQNTLTLYQNVINGSLLPHIGAVQVLQLTPAKAQHLVETLKAEGRRHGSGGLSDRSVQQAVQVLKAATRWAQETGVLNRDPLQGFKRPRAGQSGSTSAWTADEAKTFLAFVEGDRLRAAWWLLLGRGLRRGELAGLRWGQLDLDAGIMRITATRVSVNGAVLDSGPKTAAGRRSIPIDAHLCDELRAHQERQAQERAAAGEAWYQSDLVFVNEVGVGYRPETFSRRFRALSTAAGLRRIRLHDLRHTAATLMLAAGEPTKVVAEILGHSSPTITQNIYQHVVPGMSAAAGERLTGALVGAGSS